MSRIEMPTWSRWAMYIFTYTFHNSLPEVHGLQRYHLEIRLMFSSNHCAAMPSHAQRNLFTQLILVSFDFSMLCASDVRSSCRIVPGLTKEQMDLCYRANDVTRAALDGLRLAMRECQLQVYSPQLKPLNHLTCLWLVSVASLELFII